MDAKLSEDGAYYIVKYVGVRTLPKIMALLREVEENALKTEVYTYLFDLRESEEGFSVADKYTLGIHLAQLFSNKYRVAVAIRKEHLTGFLQNVSTNRGATDFLITDDEAKARGWMKRGK
jgi:hypothetical protein